MPPESRVGETDPAALPTRRWLALDVLRGVAVLLMIQGHTFTELLEPEAYVGSWVRWHKLLHGLTAPMFLLGGGVAYGIVTLRTSAERSQDRTRLVRRALWLVVIGYALQVPRASWSRIFADDQLVALTFRIGPLQLVGACLLLCEALRLSIRSRARMLGAIATVAIMTVAVAPWIWSARFSSRGWLPLGTWLDGYAASRFPFFPWAAFFLLGTLLSAWVLRAQRPQRSGRLAAGLIGVGIASASFAYAMYRSDNVMRNVYGADYALWGTSPLYVLFRAGMVVTFLGLLSASEPWIRCAWRALPLVDQVFGVISRQSLVAYVTHLLVLYGSPFTPGLARIGKTLSMGEVGIATFVVLLFTTAIAVVWNHAITEGALMRRNSLENSSLSPTR